jgi:hypothetical protein
VHRMETTKIRVSVGVPGLERSISVLLACRYVHMNMRMQQFLNICPACLPHPIPYSEELLLTKMFCFAIRKNYTHTTIVPLFYSTAIFQIRP